jgi:hypothetical protein
LYKKKNKSELKNIIYIANIIMMNSLADMTGDLTGDITGDIADD